MSPLIWLLGALALLVDRCRRSRRERSRRLAQDLPLDGAWLSGGDGATIEDYFVDTPY